jgi:integrase
MGDFKKAYITATKVADLPDLDFHDLRHTAITRMLEKGLSPILVMKASGHSQTKTFLRYVNQTETSVYEMAQKLDAA